MMQARRRLAGGAAALMALASICTIWAQDPSEEKELRVEHANCSFFGPRQQEFSRNSLANQMREEREYPFSRLATEVSIRLAPLPSDAKRERFNSASANLIDQHLRRAWEDARVTPASKTTDSEFLRRVTLDLTGRIPTQEAVERFLADTDPDKRIKLVDSLLGAPEFVDKWTMFFADLFKNTARTTQVVRYAEGRDAFHNWIKASVAANKPYDVMVRELLTARATNSYEQGEANWVIGGFVTGGPVQDIMDQQAVNVAETFLGIGHMNCIMCHDGRRHLDTLSLWGRSATRYSAYQLAAFFSQVAMSRVRVGAAATPYYWTVSDTRRTDYQLNTSTGNRPPRNPVGSVRTVTPEYPFSGGKPAAGENYRSALAREVTRDFQFARAAINYIWKEFMSKGFVEPVDQFDPARLDPDNPPEAPWKLQPNQPRLLNALAQHLVDEKFNLRALMKTIVTSEAYQLSSRYEGSWNPAWENFYARKIPRRLWAEEIHDAIVQSSRIPSPYAIRNFGTIQWAMQLPDVVGLPGGNASSWLDSFFRGNRDTESRRDEGSTLQVLNLMNDAFVMNRTRPTGTAETGSLLRRALTFGSEEQLVRYLYLNVLSRHPNNEELGVAASTLRSSSRQQRAEDLLWSLYNKVDFVFNY
jgi:hypothetical protein